MTNDFWSDAPGKVKTSKRDRFNFLMEKIEAIVKSGLEDLEGIIIPSKTSDLENDSGFITEDAISGKLDKSEIFSNGVFTTKNTKQNGTVATIWNEADGGGSMIEDGTSNVKAFTGVNEGSDGSDIYVQSYAVDKTSKIGTRININKNGAFYTKNKSTYAFSENDEIVTKAMMMEEINALKARVAELEVDDDF